MGLRDTSTLVIRRQVVQAIASVRAGIYSQVNEIHTSNTSKKGHDISLRVPLVYKGYDVISDRKTFGLVASIRQAVHPSSTMTMQNHGIAFGIIAKPLVLLLHTQVVTL